MRSTCKRNVAAWTKVALHFKVVYYIHYPSCFIPCFGHGKCGCMRFLAALRTRTRGKHQTLQAGNELIGRQDANTTDAIVCISPQLRIINNVVAPPHYYLISFFLHFNVIKGTVGSSPSSAGWKDKVCGTNKMHCRYCYSQSCVL